jgi:hypothetical protein
LPDQDEELIDFTAGDAAFTLEVDFTSLHRPPRRGGGIAKGSAHLNVFVDVGDDEVSLSVNVHVATGGDPDDA